MRPDAAIDADFVTLKENLCWLKKAGHPESDIHRFNEARERLAIDYGCVQPVQDLGNEWDRVQQYLENERSLALANAVPAGNTLPGCNGDRKTCARRAAGTTPYCKACQSSM